ncbi:Catalase4 [Ramazzottius varieornatus]|uniref:Catalase n=1 Tax=Ramazzottius varieornatus TaxID=947166 RepID=A0A1D1VZX7_RAMVA|nr:Catalase4 [Ramazzottius varieornatus]
METIKEAIKGVASGNTSAGKTGMDKGDNDKIRQLEQYRIRFKEGDTMTTNQGLSIADDKNSLKAGIRGPTLMEDFILREKMQHFDHERIPERVVHARGSGAHGHFQVYKPLTHLTHAAVFQDPAKKTPVFVRFSTVQGARGSADTVRDTRGFAVKFYTEEGNWDLVGNNMPIFFVQDTIKFMDLIHAVKPEQDWEVPQASSAHNTFWDFVTQQTETMHHVMWLMSDRALPRSYAMMQGFGVNTFKMINAEGVARFVKFHWIPLAGTNSLMWDECQKIAGKNPDFNRQDLWEAIETGNYPQYELGIQVVEEADEHKFPFDLLDATKIIPEELVPVQRIGKLTLDRNPDNFFCETEQVAFCTAHLVPGLDFSNDPLLQGRIFSYQDTQITRLGGPNFHEIPINQPVCPFQINNQRQGAHKKMIHCGKTSYDINAIQKGLPREAGPAKGFVSHAERVDGNKIRQRSPSFADHFSQATLFWKSMSAIEQDHIVSAFTFELSKVTMVEIRQRLVNMLQNVDATLMRRVATNLGIDGPTEPALPGYPKDIYAPSPNLSQLSPLITPKNTIKGRKVAVLAADGVDGAAVLAMSAPLLAGGAMPQIVSLRMGQLKSSTDLEGGKALEVNALLLGLPSVCVDAVYIPGGKESVTALLKDGQAQHYVMEAYIHCKPIAASAEGVEVLSRLGLIPKAGGQLPLGVYVADSATADFAAMFISGMMKHRFFERKLIDTIPA